MSFVENKSQEKSYSIIIVAERFIYLRVFVSPDKIIYAEKKEKIFSMKLSMMNYKIILFYKI